MNKSIIENDKMITWIDKAEELKRTLKKDDIQDPLMIAIALRNAYLLGKSDGVHQCNNGAR